MGIGQLPWFMTKIITSLYSGWFLMHYCPEGRLPEQMNTETMLLMIRSIFEPCSPYVCKVVLSSIAAAT